MRKLVAFLLVPAIVHLCGCSYSAASTQSVTIFPSHPSAEVFVDGVSRGRGKQVVELSKKRRHSVMATCGHSAGSATVNRKFSREGIIDIIGGLLFIFPFLGFTSGGAYELTPSMIAIAIPDSSACDDLDAPSS